jgi:hypothetical protein
LIIGEVRKNNPIYKINFWITICSFTLLRFATIFFGRDDFLAQNVGGIPLLAGILMNAVYLFQNRVKTSINQKRFVLFLASLLLWITAIIRSVVSFSMLDRIFVSGLLVQLLLFLGYGFLALLVNQQVFPKFDLRKAILYSVIALVATNFFLFFAGLNPKDTIYLSQFPAQILSNLGIRTYRTLFPLAMGINNYGVVIGIALVSAALLWAGQKKGWKWLVFGACVVICLVSLLMVDSRGPFVFSVLALAIVLLPKKLFSIFRWFPFLISLLPLFFILVPKEMATTSLAFMNRESHNFQKSPGISEQQNCDAFIQNLTGTLSNRPVIWNAGLSELAAFKPIHIWGYGYRGQVISGISSQYSCLFLSYAKSEISGLHNIWLQQIISTGYIGALFLIVNLVSSLVFFTCDSKNRCLSRAFLGILLYCLLAGSMEAIFTPDYFQVFLMLLYIFLISIFEPREDLYATA